jgi:hypothetical protein
MAKADIGAGKAGRTIEPVLYSAVGKESPTYIKAPRNIRQQAYHVAADGMPGAAAGDITGLSCAGTIRKIYGNQQ